MVHVMSEVKRDVCHGCVSLPRDTHCPVCDPNIGWRKELDAQRLRADTAEAQTKLAERELEIAAEQLVAAEQRIAVLIAAARCVLQAYDSGDASDALDSLAAALNPNPECCKVSPEDQALLNAGEYNPEELFGIGGKPSCPKCFNPNPEAESHESN